MSDRYTAVSGPGPIALLGRLTRREALEKRRKYYEHERDRAIEALAVPEEELRVTTFIGLYARRREQEVDA